MPKRVDHAQRRDELSQAVWTIAATKGLHAASLREVAAEAGVSMGTVQHYFGSREQMVHHACQRLVDLAGQGLRAMAVQTGTPPEPREVLRLVAVQSLPTTAAERSGAGVWQGFVAQGLLDPGLAAVVRTAWDGAHDLVTEQLRHAQAAGQLRGGTEASRAATALLALVDGLVPRLVLGDLTAERALQVVDEHLAHLFAGASDR